MGDTHPRNHVVLCLAMIVVPVGTAPAIGQVEFVEVGASRGIEPYCMASGMGGGVAAADFDDDGDIDLDDYEAYVNGGGCGEGDIPAL